MSLSVLSPLHDLKARFFLSLCARTSSDAATLAIFSSLTGGVSAANTPDPIKEELGLPADGPGLHLQRFHLVRLP